MSEHIISTTVGERWPGAVPGDECPMVPTIANGDFRLIIFFPHLSAKEVRNFNTEATFIALRERHLLYLSVIFGETGAESTYTIYKDYPSARQVMLPRVATLPEGMAPAVSCVLVDSTTGIVRAIRTGCPPGFSRTWLSAIEDQKTTPYDEGEERRWAAKLAQAYPDTLALLHHPQAVVGTVGGFGRTRFL
jgi:hypothetical protein